MTQYKLKLWYPGLPHEWRNEEVIVEQTLPTYSFYFKKGDLIPDEPYEYFPRLEYITVENNPTFWEEMKSSIGKTEAGEDIKLNDIVYAVDGNFNLHVIKVEGELSKNNKYYHNKHLAEHYIEFNKPCYSINDLQRLIDEKLKV